MRTGPTGRGEPGGTTAADDAPTETEALIARILARIGDEMEAHMQKEEVGLFPTILAGGSVLTMAIEIMREDHDDHAARLEEVGALTAGLTVPDDAGEAWSALHAGLRGFAADLREHIRLENDELFPRFGA